jgi:hypothetical protein
MSSQNHEIYKLRKVNRSWCSILIYVDTQRVWTTTIYWSYTCIFIQENAEENGDVKQKNYAFSTTYV